MIKVKEGEYLKGLQIRYLMSAKPIREFAKIIPLSIEQVDESTMGALVAIADKVDDIRTTIFEIFHYRALKKTGQQMYFEAPKKLKKDKKPKIMNDDKEMLYG